MKPAILSLLPRLRLAAQCGLLLGLSLSAPVFAAITDVGNAPLFTSSATAVKPNLMFILDDSGSMKSDYLPDEAGNFSTSTYGRKSYQCNGVAYNPTITYSLPVDYTGTQVAAASLSFITPNPASQTGSQHSLGSNISSMPAVGGNITVSVQGNRPRSSWYSNGDTVTVFQDSTTYFVGTVTSWDPNTRALKINVTFASNPGSSMTSPTVGDGEPASATYYKYTGSQDRLGYTYDSAGNVITTSTFYKECKSYIGSSPGNAVFTPVTITASSSDAQNYANWFVYYRTRMAMMKSSVSLAFKNIDSRYRVGYSTISEDSATEGTNFLNIRDMDATQKQKFYTAVNNAQPISWTPLRGALAKAGQYFGNKANGQSLDPVQYSCQRSFTILSTDGYWNTQDESIYAPKYGPYQMDNNTLVGQQDGGGTKRPMFDGGTVTRTTTETYTVTTVTTASVNTPHTTTAKISSTTTTIAPVTGYEQWLYSMGSPVQSTSSLTRPGWFCGSSCWVTVNLPSNHGLSNGDSVTISGGSESDYRGTFSGSNVEVIDSNSFRYRLSSRPDNPSGTYTITPAASASCSAGNGMVTKQRQTQDKINTTVLTTATTTLTLSTTTQVVTTTKVTPYTRVYTESNGIITSDTGDIAGQEKVTSTGGPVSTVTGTPSSSVATTSATTASFTPWVNSGGAVSLGCQSSVPATTTGTLASTTTAAQPPTGSAPVTAAPTTQDGTATSTPSGSTSTPTARTTVTTAQSTGGVSNTLADVAMYYYQTDLRNTSFGNCSGALGSDVCKDNVPGSDADAAHSFGDNAKWQHMTTFTIGLGLSGALTYDPDYLSLRSGDFYNITNNNKNWPTPGPTEAATNIDDLWHAAVNGRGQYFSAGDPDSLSRSLNSALNTISGKLGSASAASTSSLQPVQGDNDIYVAQFKTQEWVGDVLSFKIDPTTGMISSTPTWSAQTQLDLATPSGRTIYYKKPSGGTPTLQAFTYANLTSDGYNGLFDGFCSKTGASGSVAPEQCADLATDATKLAAANSGSNLVSYLRGDQTLASYYRTRTHLLGDVINASPLFVGKPGFKYTENSYAAFATAKAGRTAVVLAAANDGMLHAFDRITGNELWAYIPSFAMKNMYKLADRSFTNNHSYFVDGSPQMGDIYADDGDGSGPHWKTIAVGGLNAGGRGYYALDVTNPAAPKLLWEFSNNDLGLSFGNPIITKRADNTWVVVFGSGYNNVSPGDGNGHLFVLNANTGALITQVKTFTSGSTPAGDTTTPSGLARINSWIDSEVVNQSKRFYGGDLLGNVWRFDLDNLVAPNGAAMLLGQLTSPDGTGQPISVKPAVAEVTYNGAKYPVVYIPTGRYLGTSDLTNNQVQTVYAIKDPLTATGWGVVRTNALFVAQTLTDTGNNARTGSDNDVDWSTKAGWRVDLPGTGERVSVNPQLALDTIYVGTNKPNNDACTVGGDSFLYQFNIARGSSTSNYVGNVLIQGLTLVQLTTGAADGSVVTIITRSDGTVQTVVGSPGATTVNLRRTSWRELVE